MLRDTTVIWLRQSDAIDDPLSELAREGARRMLAQALTAEPARLTVGIRSYMLTPHLPVQADVMETFDAAQTAR